MSKKGSVTCRIGGTDVRQIDAAHVCRHDSCHRAFDGADAPGKRKREHELSDHRCPPNARCCVVMNFIKKLSSFADLLYREGDCVQVRNILQDHADFVALVTNSEESIVSPPPRKLKKVTNSCESSETFYHATPLSSRSSSSSKASSSSLRTSSTTLTPSSLPELTLGERPGTTSTTAVAHLPASISESLRRKLSSVSPDSLVAVAVGAVAILEGLPENSQLRPILRSAFLRYVPAKEQLWFPRTTYMRTNRWEEHYATEAPNLSPESKVLLYGVPFKEERSSFKEELQGMAADFWKLDYIFFPSATKVILIDSDSGTPQQQAIHYYYDTEDVLFTKYQEWWATTGYAKLKEHDDRYKDIDVILQRCPTSQDRLDYLIRERIILSSRDQLMSEKPLWVKCMRPKDFACPHCRRSAEWKSSKERRRKDLHADCPQNCQVDKWDTCPSFMAALERETSWKTKEYELKFGRARYCDMEKASKNHATHIEHVNRQRRDGLAAQRTAMKADPSRAIIIADWTGLDFFYRPEGKSQQELRLVQLRLLCLCVITYDSNIPAETITYHDFTDQTSQTDLQSFVYAFTTVVGTLMDGTKKISKIDLWTDNCRKQFHSRNPLYAIMIEVGNIFSNKLEELAWNFFVPNHGKCLCNAHFGTLKRKLRNEASVGGGFNTIEKLPRIMENDSHVVRPIPPNLPPVTDVAEIPVVTSYHCFRRDFGKERTVRCFKFSTETDSRQGVSHVFVLRSEDSASKTTEKATEKGATAPCSSAAPILAAVAAQDDDDDGDGDSNMRMTYDDVIKNGDASEMFIGDPTKKELF